MNRKLRNVSPKTRGTCIAGAPGVAKRIRPLRVGRGVRWTFEVSADVDPKIDGLLQRVSALGQVVERVERPLEPSARLDRDRAAASALTGERLRCRDRWRRSTRMLPFFARPRSKNDTAAQEGLAQEG